MRHCLGRDILLLCCYSCPTGFPPKLLDKWEIVSSLQLKKSDITIDTWEFSAMVAQNGERPFEIILRTLSIFFGSTLMINIKVRRNKPFPKLSTCLPIKELTLSHSIIYLPKTHRIAMKASQGPLQSAQEEFLHFLVLEMKRFMSLCSFVQ